jgi:hypothetical protein
MVLLSAICVTKANSLMPQVQWSKTYNGTAGFSAIQTAEQGYLIAGYNESDFPNSMPLLIKTDAYGNPLLEKTYGTEFHSAQSIVQTIDGNYALSGWGGWLMKVNPEGKILWYKNYDYMQRSIAIQTTDKGYALTGSVEPAIGKNDAIIIKTDESGNLLWKKSISGNHSNVLALNFIETSDGGYAVVGDAENEYWLAKTDSSGNLLWDKTLQNNVNSSYQFFTFYSIAQAHDGGFILAGGDARNAWLFKVDANGNTLWKQPYQAGPYWFSSVVQISDGGYIAGGEDTNRRALLVRTDSNGNLVWNATYGEQNGNQSKISSVIITEDGGYAITGWLNGSAWLAKFAPEAGVSPSPSIPEFPIWTVLPLTFTFAVVVLAAAMLRLKRLRRN